MCGLVGAVGAISLKEEKVFKQLLVLDVLRGEHSTGVASIGRNDIAITKQVGSPFELFGMKAFDNLMNRGHLALIGHNRYATKGKINKQNAHPFHIGDIVGAHNGTLHNQWRLPDHQDFDVDSENIFHSFNEIGVEETCKKLDGAFALTWYDDSDETINFLRNKERPLFYAYTKERKTIFWASEVWMLLAACHRCDVEILKPIEVPVHKHISIGLQKEYYANAKPLDNVKTKDVEVYQAPVKKPLTPFTSGSQTSSSWVDVNKYLKKRFEFHLLGEATTVQGMSYLFGYPADDRKARVRLYVDPNTKKGKALFRLDKVLVGEGKKVGYDCGSHIVMDLRTVKVVEPLVGKTTQDDGVTYEEEGDDKPDFYIGYNGTILTEEQFIKNTEAGCSWCSSPCSLDDVNEILFISRNEHICKDCQELDEVKQYLIN